MPGMRAASLLALVTACSGLQSSRRDEAARPRPLVLDPDAPLPVAGTCTWPGGAARANAIPAELKPRLEHGLELVELRGDLRLSTAVDTGWRKLPTAWSQDGKWLAVGESSGVFVWEAATGALRAVVSHRNVQAVALSADGEQVAFVASPGGVYSLFVASVAEPRRLRRFDAPELEWMRSSTADTRVLRFSSDDTRVISQDNVGSPATVWDLATGRRILAKATRYGSLVLPDGVHLVDLPLSRSNDAVELRELATGRVLRRFPVDMTAGWSVSDDGTRIAIATRAGIDVHALDDGRVVRHFPELAQDASGDFEQGGMLSPDGSRLLVTRIRKTGAAAIRHDTEMWDVQSGRRLWQGYLGYLGYLGLLRFSEDGQYLLSTSPSGVMYRADDGTPLVVEHGFVGLSPDSRWQLLEPTHLGSSQPNWLELAPVDAGGAGLGIARAGSVVARSRDSRYTASIGAEGQLQLESENGCIALGISTSLSEKATFSADGQFLLLALRAAGTAYAWRTDDGAAVRAVKGSGGILELLADTGRVIFGQHRLQRGVPVRRVYDLLAGQEMHYPAMTQPVLDPLSLGRQTAATHDGRELFVAGTPALERVDLDDPSRDTVLHPRASIVAISEDDRLVAAATGRRVDIWTRVDWHPQVDVTHEQPVTRLAFSPDGKQLVSADEGGLVIVTRTLDGARLAQLRLPYDRVTYLWFSPDGTELEVDTARGLRVLARLVLP